jgi:hypothetical protein
LSDPLLFAIAVAVAVGALVFTAATQFRTPRLERWARSRDVFLLLPMWTFFAPNPGSTDARLLWREALGSRHFGPWHELSPPRSHPWRAFWNPNRRIQKAIADAGGLLAQGASEAESTTLTIPYLLLLKYVAAQAGSPHAIARQFAVVQTSGEPPEFDEVRVVARSRWHAVGETGDALGRVREPLQRHARRVA